MGSRATVEILLCATLLACSHTSYPPSLGDGIPEGGIEAAVYDSGLPPIDANGQDVGLGLGVVDVPDTPCVMRGGTSGVVYPATEAGVPPSFDRMAMVGSRRVAEGANNEGFVTFDVDGKNASPLPPKGVGAIENKVASTGSTIAVAGVSGDKADEDALFASFDPTGMAQGSTLTLATEEVHQIAVGGNAGLALATWAGATSVRAAGVDATGASAGPAYDLTITNFLNALSTSIVDDTPGRFAAAFSGTGDGKIYQTVLARGTTTARVADPLLLFMGPLPAQVTQLVRTPTGYALVLSVGTPDTVALLVLLDPTGHTYGPAHRLLGTAHVFGLAAQGSELGVVAEHHGGADAGAQAFTVEFRPFDSMATPLGSWVCLDGPIHDSIESAAIDADGTGYAVLYRAPDSSDVLVRFDHLGTGSP